MITSQQIALLARDIDMPASWGKIDLPEVSDVLGVSESEADRLWREYERTDPYEVRLAVIEHCSPERAAQIIETLGL